MHIFGHSHHQQLYPTTQEDGRRQIVLSLSLTKSYYSTFVILDRQATRHILTTTPIFLSNTYSTHNYFLPVTLPRVTESNRLLYAPHKIQISLTHTYWHNIFRGRFSYQTMDDVVCLFNAYIIYATLSTSLNLINYNSFQRMNY
jgi:hypothetical protein